VAEYNISLFFWQGSFRVFCPSGRLLAVACSEVFGDGTLDGEVFYARLRASSEKESVSLYTDTHYAGEQAYRLFPALPQTTHLTICDLRLTAPDLQLTIATLAGVVNRGPQRLYFIESDDDIFWLSELGASLPRTRLALAGDDLLAHLLTEYRDHLTGLILYDPALPDTRNVASVLAALDDGLAVSPTQAQQLQNDPYRLPVLADLRIHAWKSSVQVYRWAYDHLLPRCSANLLAGLDPTISARLRSFLVTHRIFTCWLDTRRIARLSSPGWLSGRGLFRHILARFAPGSLYLGWFPDEPSGIRLTSRAALLTLASDHCTNLTVWSNLPERARESDPTLSGSPTLSLEDRAGAGRQAKRTYLSFTFSDGDNLQYCQHRLLRLWQDPARGSLPLGWTIAPALGQAMPALAAFYRRTATANDEFIAGPSGAAYLLPSRLPRAQRAAFLQRTAASMQAMQLTLLQILDSNTRFSMKWLHPGLQKLFIAHLAPYGLRGVFSGAGSVSPSWHRRAGLPIYQNLGLAMTPQRTLQLILRAAARGQRFINVYVFAWRISPGDLFEIVKQLDGTFCLVTPGRLLELIEQEG